MLSSAVAGLCDCLAGPWRSPLLGGFCLEGLGSKNHTAQHFASLRLVTVGRLPKGFCNPYRAIGAAQLHRAIRAAHLTSQTHPASQGHAHLTSQGRASQGHAHPTSQGRASHGSLGARGLCPSTWMMTSCASAVYSISCAFSEYLTACASCSSSVPGPSQI